MGNENRKQEIVGKYFDGPVSRHLNRKISTQITSFIIKHNIPLTPNQVSLMAFLLAIMATPLYLTLYAPYIVLAGILVQVSSIIDGVDGELARARKILSKRGGFLDTMLDRYADIAIISSIAISTVLIHDYSLLWIIVGLIALSGNLMVSYIHTRVQRDFNIHPALIGHLNGIASRDVRLFTIFIGSLLGYIDYALLAIAIYTHLYVIVKLVNIFFWKTNT